MADWLRVQGTNTESGTGLTNSLSFGAAVTSGNIVVGGLLLQNNSNNALPVGVVSVTDDMGNAYRVVNDGCDAVVLCAASFRSLHKITNGPTTITVTVAASASVFWMAIEEFSPPTGTTDISLSGQQYLVNDPGLALANFQVLDNDCLVWGIAFSTGVSTTGAGFTTGQGSGTNLASQWKIQATANNAVGVAWATQTGTVWAVAMAIAPVAQTRWEPIQRQMQRTGSGTTASISFPRAVSSGSIVVGSIAVDNGGLATLTSFKDDKNNVYSLISGTLNAGQGTGDRQTFWSGGFVTNGPTTVTANFSVSQSIALFLIDEFAPPPGASSVAIDGTPVNTFDSNAALTSITTPNVSTLKSGDLAYGWADNAGREDNPGNSFCATNGQSLTWMSAYYITGAPGSYNFVCNHGAAAGGNDASLVIFNATFPTTLGFGTSFYRYGV